VTDAAPHSPRSVDTAAEPASRILTGRMPDLTPAQLVGIAGAVISVAVSFGVDLSKDQQEAILALVAVLAGVLFAADAHLRARRVEAEAVRHLADRHLAAVRHVADRHVEMVQQALTADQPPPSLVLPAPPSPPGR
jgi:hypothetical protein